MSARILQGKIHSDFSTGVSVWNAYKIQINELYASSSAVDDFNDHLIREFNRKISILNQPTGLFFSPFDAGFRFLGSASGAPTGISPGVLLFNGEELIYNGVNLSYNA
jgi:hypothetical protein